MADAGAPHGLWPDVKGPDDLGRLLDVSRETLERLAIYARLLVERQKVMNLVSPASLPGLWHRHMADSAQLLPLVSDAPAIRDLGSGAGFPGMVLAILLDDPAYRRPGRRVELIESIAKKCAFLREVAAATAAPVDINHSRIEKLSEPPILRFEGVITARALANFSELLALCSRFMLPPARAVFLKGETVEEEIADAKTRWNFSFRFIPSRTHQSGRVVEVWDVKPKGRNR